MKEALQVLFILNPPCSQRRCRSENNQIFFVLTIPEYVTFLALPGNSTEVHVVNRKPLFTHLGEHKRKGEGYGSVC